MRSLVLMIMIGVLWAALEIPSAMALDCKAGLQAKNGVCLPTKDQTGLNDGTLTIEGAIYQFLLLVTSFLGVLAMLVIVISGILYMTAGGDGGRIDAAKRWLLYGIIGLIVALLAWVIVRAISGALLGGGECGGVFCIVF